MEIKRKKCKVVMLPTKDKTNIGLNVENILIYSEHKQTTFHSSVKCQHLYITSDDKIKEGDWVSYDCEQVIVKFDSKVYGLDCCTKIIATTDKSLFKEISIGTIEDQLGVPINYEQVKEIFVKEYLPQPSQSFIEKYCKVGGIDEVMVEYNSTHLWIHPKKYENDQVILNCNKVIDYIEKGTYNPELYHTPKVNSHNEITIHPIKNSWSKEEVEEKMRLSYIYGQAADKLEHFTIRENWIKENIG